MGNEQGTHGEKSQRSTSPYRDAHQHQQESKIQTSFRNTYKKLKQQSPNLTNHIKEEEFSSIFNKCPIASKILLHLLHKNNKGQNEAVIHEEDFVSIGMKLSAASDVKVLTDLLVSNATEAGVVKKLEFQNLVQASFTGSLLISHVSKVERLHVESLAKAIVDSVFGIKNAAEKDDICRWIGYHCPLIFIGFQKYTISVLCDKPLGHKNRSRTPSPSRQANLLQSLISGYGITTFPVILAVSCILNPCYFQDHHGTHSQDELNVEKAFHGWYQLYSSNQDGLSMTGFSNHVIGYKGMTVMFIQFGDSLFCFALDEGWREGLDRWGDLNSCLIQILPKYTVLQGGSKMILFNKSSRNASLRGLQIGKNPSSILLKIDGEMENVTYHGLNYRLSAMEVWGCSSEHLEDHLKQKKWETRQANANKDRKLNITAEEWKESADRQILEMGGVTTEHAQR